MRQFVILFFTFSGICKGFAQSPAATVQADSLGKVIPVIERKDSAVKEKPTLKIYPNPAKNKVELELKAFQPGFVQLQILDTKGNKVRDDKRMLFSGNESIAVMFSLAPGIYFLQLKQGNVLLKKKLLVQD